MIENTEKIFNLLRYSNSWMRVKSVADRLGFKKVGIVTGCIVALKKKGMILEKEQLLLDGTSLRFYHIASWCKNMTLNEALIECACGYKNVLPNIVTMWEEIF